MNSRVPTPPRQGNRGRKTVSARARTLSVFRLAGSFWRDARKIARIQRRLPPSAAAAEVRSIYRQGGRRFRQEALKLGGLLIKVGQFLSARTDVLPLEFTRELAALQDQVPSAPFADVRQVVEAAYDAPMSAIFAEFHEQPLAAASLGQVHRARLSGSDEWVAVKVQRPGIEVLAAVDLRALGWIMRVLTRWTTVGRRVDAYRLFEEFRNLVGQELDYLHEQANLQEFWNNFQSRPGIRVPQPRPHATRRRVLVMELVEGVKLTDREALLGWNLEPRILSQRLVTAYLQQIIVDGLVQIDPHPGNFLADREGRLVLLDFGMCSRIPPAHIPYASKLIQGILARNPGWIVQALSGLGFIRPEADASLFVRSLRALLQQMHGVALQPGPALDQAVSDFQEFLYQEPLMFPAEYMFLGRAIGMLFGLANQMDSDVDWLSLITQQALPMMASAQQTSLGWSRRLGRVAQALAGDEVAASLSLGANRILEWIDLWGRLPSELDRVLQAAEDHGLTTRPAWTPILRRLEGIRAEVRLLTYSVLLAGSVVAWEISSSRRDVLIHGLFLGTSLVLVLLWILAAVGAGRHRRRTG